MQFKGKLLISKTHIKEKEVHPPYSCLIENEIFEKNKDFWHIPKVPLALVILNMLFVPIYLSQFDPI